jgi:hypothetical protein
VTTSGRPGSGTGSGDEPVGSLADETRRLLEALLDRGATSGAEDAATWADRAAAMARDVNEHLATGGAECTFCPVCRAIALVRETSPEVRAHLATAASSLLQAAAGLLAAAPDLKQEHDAARRSASDVSGVEHIDLDGDEA